MLENYKVIDIDNWNGKKHYLWFKKYPMHYYNITKTIDITKLIDYISSHNINNEKPSFYITMIYLITKSLNAIEEMRLRVIGDKVVTYDIIHPAYTVMTNEGVFENADSEYYDDFLKFYQEAKSKIDEAKQKIRPDKEYNDKNRYDQYYLTCIPWIDFTGLLHPMPDDDSSYVPRVCWSKFYKENSRTKISLNIQVSHALVDGFPLAKAFLKVEENINNIELLGLNKN